MKKIIGVIIILVIAGVSGFFGWKMYDRYNSRNPKSVVEKYYSYVANGEYEKMYEMLTDDCKSKVTQEDFIKRNKNIYNGIDFVNVTVDVTNESKDLSDAMVSYDMEVETLYGSKKFKEAMDLKVDDTGSYKILWNSKLIFPKLEENYKVKVNTTEPQRGRILDRNGYELAAQGSVSSVGIVPGKLGENKEESIKKIAEILGITADGITKSLSAGWVKDDSFVPLKNVSMDDVEKKEALLKVPGVKITAQKSRVYPFSYATAPITGYVQNVTAEDLEKNEGKGYTSTSIIGKKGLEKQYEDRLRGQKGVDIYIVDENNNRIDSILEKDVQNGEDIKLTIDLAIQNKLYEQMKDDKGFFVVMNSKTGELLALVSTPSYDCNKFVLGMNNDEWKALSEDKNNPMYTRYLQTWCPGSTFKAVTGAIGLSSNKLSVSDEFNYTGLAWQKDKGWGSYEITTLTAYNSAKNLQNALVHSDNIYFGQAALKIGKDTFKQYLDKLLFNESIGILGASKSKYSNNNALDKETLLADTGYGQGQLLVNPIHMASIYSAFANSGDMVKPYIEYKENTDVEYLIQGAFTPEAANTIKDDLIQVIESPEGTAHDMKINGVTLAGKTGTAELKQAKGEEGQTLGWFDCFVADDNYKDQLLVVSMVEDAKTNGGSHYLIKKIRTLFE